MIRGIGTITPLTRDLRKSLFFYRDILGIPVKYVDRALERTVLGFKDGVLIAPYPARNVRGRRSKPGEVEIDLIVDDVHGTYKDLERKGVRCVSPPQRTREGGWAAKIEDPDGIPLTLYQPPKKAAGFKELRHFV